ncbi:MAG: phytoene desaturase family protein, partial [Microvirga sp.]
MERCDVVVIGAGHNGLTCAAYLARAGLRVKVVERRHIVGGAAVTEEFHPGFRNSVASYTVSLLNPKIIRDLDLHRHGLTIVERRAQNFLPLFDGRYLLSGEGRTKAEIAKFSSRDALRYDAFAAELERIADVLRALVLQAPPNVVEGWSARSIAELARAAAVGDRLRRLSMPDRRALLDLFTKSAGDYLDGWFEAEPVKALFGFDAVVGNYASPYAPGSAYVMLHHVFGEVNGKKGVWGHAIGGMGAITQALAAEARRWNVDIECNAPVQRIGRGSVVLEDGSEIAARAVVANVNPKLLFLKLVEPDELDADFRERIERYKCGSATFRMNVALSELPDFTAAPGKDLQPHHTGSVELCYSPQYAERAFQDAHMDRKGANRPFVDGTIPTSLDKQLAPEGVHVFSMFSQ